MANDVRLRIAMDGTAEVVDSTNRIGSGLSNLGAQAQAANNGLGTLRTALAGIATLATAVVITKMADSVTTLRTQLNLSAVSAQQAAQAYESLFQIAQKGRVSFTELGTTYAAIARAGNEMGVSQTRLLAVTESISQAMTIGGGSAQSMQAALVQLGQGLSSGTLRGEELNSIMEQTPRLAKAIADGLGVPIGELRKLGETGQLTAQQVINALEKSGPQLAKEMASATLTVGQAMTLLGNSATKMVGEMDAASGASATLASAVKGISGAMDTVGKVIKDHETAFKFITYTLGSAAVVAGLYGTAVAIGAVWAAVTLGGSVAVTAALAALGAVIGLSIAAGSELSQTEGVLKISLAKINNEIDAAEKAKNSELVARLNERKKLLEDELADKRQKTVEMNMIGGQQSPDRVLDRIAATEGQAAQKAYQALKFELSGVNKEFQKHLDILQAKRGATDYSEKQYIEDVIELINKEGGARKAAHAEKPKYDEFAAPRESAKAYAKTIEEFQQAELKAQTQTDGLTASQGKLLGMLTDPSFQAMPEAWKQTQLQAAYSAIAVEQNVVAMDAANKAHKDYIAGLTSSADSVAKNVAALKDETAAYAVAAEKNISLAEAIDVVAISRLEELKAVQMSYGDETAVAQLEREIELRKQLAPLIRKRDNYKGEIEAGKEAAKATADAWKKGWEETDRLARDAFTSWAENGTSMADAIGKSLKKALLSAIYDATIKPLALQIYTSIAGGAPGSVLQAASGAGNTLNAVSGASSLASWAPAATSAVGAFSNAALASAQSMVGMTGTTAQMVTSLSQAGYAGTTALSGFAATAAKALPYVGVALLAIRALNGNGQVSAADSGRAAIDYTASGVGSAARNTTGDASQIGTATNAANTIEKAYQDAAKAFGIKSLAGSIEVGYNTGAGGAHPNTVIGAAFGGLNYSSGEVSSADNAAVQLAASRAVFTALQASELPGYLKTVFNGITASTATEAQINDTLAYAASLKTVREAMLETRDPVQILKDTVSTGFTNLKTSAATFKTDFVAAIDAGISPDNLAKWDGLRVAMDNLANSAGNASALVGNIASALGGAQQDYADANRTAYDLLNQAQTDAAGAASSGGGGGGGSSGGSTDNGLADAIQYLADTKTGISQWLDKLNTSDAGGLSSQHQTTNAWAAFQSQMTLAQGGDRTALGGITGYADSYIQAIKSTSKTALEEQLAIAKTKAQVGNLPNSLRPEQFIVEALTGSSSGGGSGGSVVSAIKSLNSKLIADLNVSARSEIVKLITFISNTDKLPDDLKALALASSDLMTKTVSFITGSKLSDDNKALALATNTDLTKTVNYALGIDIPREYKELALKASDSIEKTISFTARNMLDPNQATLALMTDATIVKTIGAAAGHMDKSAMVVALAQSETVRKMIEASGGILTADQATLLNNVTDYNKQINLQISLDPGAVTAAQAYMQAAFGTINVQTIMSGQTASATAPAIQAQTPAQLLKGFIDDQLKYAQTSGEGAAVANVYGAARTYGFTQGDIATVGGYSTAEVNALFDKYNIPRFDVGTDYVPKDMLAQIHEGEQIVPKAYNPNANGNQPRDNAGIERKLEQLQADARVAQATMAALMSRLVKLNERWDGDGMPAVRSLT